LCNIPTRLKKSIFTADELKTRTLKTYLFSSLYTRSSRVQLLLINFLNSSYPILNSNYFVLSRGFVVETTPFIYLFADSAIPQNPTRVQSGPKRSNMTLNLKSSSVYPVDELFARTLTKLLNTLFSSVNSHLTGAFFYWKTPYL